MSKLLTTLLAAIFAAVTLTPVAFAAKHEREKKEMKKEVKAEKKAATADEKKAARAALAKACKGKKPGEEVTVDGKNVKCPAPKKAAEKPAVKK